VKRQCGQGQAEPTRSNGKHRQKSVLCGSLSDESFAHEYYTKGDQLKRISDADALPERLRDRRRRTRPPVAKAVRATDKA
jgi:hypothetical protein